MAGAYAVPAARFVQPLPNPVHRLSQIISDPKVVPLHRFHRVEPEPVPVLVIHLK